MHNSKLMRWTLQFSSNNHVFFFYYKNMEAKSFSNWQKGLSFPLGMSILQLFFLASLSGKVYPEFSQLWPTPLFPTEQLHGMLCRRSTFKQHKTRWHLWSPDISHNATTLLTFFFCGELCAIDCHDCVTDLGSAKSKWHWCSSDFSSNNSKIPQYGLEQKTVESLI